MATPDKWVHWPNSAIEVDTSGLKAVTREALNSANVYLDSCLKEESVAKSNLEMKQHLREMAESTRDYWKQAWNHVQEFEATDDVDQD